MCLWLGRPVPRLGRRSKRAVTARTAPAPRWRARTERRAARWASCRARTRTRRRTHLGPYLNVGVGGEGSDLRTESRCESGDDVIDDVSCSAVSVRLGVELRYTFTPAEQMSGWVGYGFGYTVGSQTISDEGRYTETSTARGLELARLTGGLDFRLTRGFGLGPYAMASLGRYTTLRTEIRNTETAL